MYRGFINGSLLMGFSRMSGSVGVGFSADVISGSKRMGFYCDGHIAIRAARIFLQDGSMINTFAPVGIFPISNLAPTGPCVKIPTS